MKQVRITVVKKASYPDLIEKYENPLPQPCSVEEGQSWISEDAQCPEGFCQSAWQDLYPYVFALANGTTVFFNNWMKQPGTACVSCNDGFRPVSFLLEVQA